jgi:hypothetical protein
MEPEVSLPCSQNPQLIHYLSRKNPVHAVTLYFFMIYFNIILPSTTRSPIFTVFMSKVFMHFALMWATCADHHIALGFVNLMIFAEDHEL